MPIISLFSVLDCHKHKFRTIILKHDLYNLTKVDYPSDEETLYFVDYVDQSLRSLLTTYLVNFGSESTNFLIKE